MFCLQNLALFFQKYHFVFGSELPKKPGHFVPLTGHSSSDKKYSSVPAKIQQMVTLHRTKKLLTKFCRIAPNFNLIISKFPTCILTRQSDKTQNTSLQYFLFINPLQKQKIKITIEEERI